MPDFGEIILWKLRLAKEHDGSTRTKVLCRSRWSEDVDRKGVRDSLSTTKLLENCIEQGRRETLHTGKGCPAAQPVVSVGGGGTTTVCIAVRACVRYIHIRLRHQRGSVSKYEKKRWREEDRTDTIWVNDSVAQRPQSCEQFCLIGCERNRHFTNRI